MSAASSREIVIAHSSDLHLGTDLCFGPPDGCSLLREVLAVAGAAGADLVMLAGDTFDHNRQSSRLLDRAVAIMGAFRAPIVILPGNHDPLTPDSVYRRADLNAAPNVCVLGLTVEEAALFSELELEIRGKAHLDYTDMSPLVGPAPRRTRWQIAAAHGHYVEEPDEPGRFLGSWLIRSEELVATGADYVALGHWNRAARVGDPEIHAYYSGSPDYAGTVNVIRLSKEGRVDVAREAVKG